MEIRCKTDRPTARSRTRVASPNRTRMPSGFHDAATIPTADLSVSKPRETLDEFAVRSARCRLAYIIFPTCILHIHEGHEPVILGQEFEQWPQTHGIPCVPQ